MNPDNSQAVSALTFLLFWTKKSSNFESLSTPRLLHHDNDLKKVVSSQPSITWYKSANQKIGIRTVYESLIIVNLGILNKVVSLPDIPS